jgi:transposase
MFAVEIYAAVRRFVFVEGKSRREAARVFGLSRDTISKMCRYSAPPGYVRSKQPERAGDPMKPEILERQIAHAGYLTVERLRMRLTDESEREA